jgi:stage II sporulation protein D
MEGMRMRGALVALAVLLAGAVPAEAAPAPVTGPVPVLVVDGRGWGHGVGMAQEGALSMARAGQTTPQILGHFYPGTSIGKGSGDVRVVIFPGPGQDADLAFPNGGEVRDALSGQQSPGFPVRVPAGQTVHIHFDGQQLSVTGGEPAQASARANAAAVPSASAGAAPTSPLIVEETTTTTTALTLPANTTTTSTTAPPSSSTTTSTPTSSTSSTLLGVTTSTAAPTTTTTTAPTQGQPGSPAPSPSSPPTTGGSSDGPTSTRSLWAVPSGSEGTVSMPSRNRTYRGVIQAAPSGGDLRLVNQVDIEQYLRGMGEVRNPSWPENALKVQAIAARTYALRAMAAGGEICDDDRCQVYLGAQAEYPAMDKAVKDSAHQVVMYGKGLASTFYSANAGGFSATPEEGFGSSNTNYPYQQASPYKSDDPMPWQVKVALTDVAGRFGVKGTLKDVQVAATGPSGRATSVALTSDAGTVSVTGLQFASRLGLRSTLVTLHTENAIAPPPPPPADGALQVPPDQAAAIAGAGIASAAPDDGIGLPDPSVAPYANRAMAAPSHENKPEHTGRLFGMVGLLLVVYAGTASPILLGERSHWRHRRPKRLHSRGHRTTSGAGTREI